MKICDRPEFKSKKPPLTFGENDKVLDFNEVKILIDSTSLEFINDAKLDFVEDMIGSYFKISNPKATSTCGCGISFSV